MTRLFWKCWAHSVRPAMRRYTAALQNPESAQRQVFSACMQSLEGTAFAREHGLKPQTDLSVFRESVPVIDPPEWEAWTQRILRGESAVLTRDPVERLVPTSGSTGPAKLVPMTAASRREYALAVNLWIGDTLRNHSDIQKGRAYIATSPAQSFSIPDAVVPVGYAEDGAYLHPLARCMFQRLLAVPTTVATLRGDAWKIRVTRLLDQARDLRFLSLWHPGYLEALFGPEAFGLLPENWPRLSVISCWADGACAASAAKLLQAFPGATLQRKGLWLTEGVISLPWQGETPLALLNGFLEFEAQSGHLLLAHELEQGAYYRPVLSNHAGLVRVRIGDQIQVSGFLGRTPCIRWIGRADAVSDLRGEKLSEAQVAEAFFSAGMPDDACLRPDPDGNPPGYVLHTDRKTLDLSILDQALRRNPHYDWARTLAQLAPPRQAAALPQHLRPGEHSKSSRLILKPKKSISDENAG